MGTGFMTPGSHRVNLIQEQDTVESWRGLWLADGRVCTWEMLILAIQAIPRLVSSASDTALELTYCGPKADPTRRP